MLDKARLQELDHFFNFTLNQQSGMILAFKCESSYFKCFFCRGSLLEKLGLSTSDVQGNYLHNFMQQDELDYAMPFFEQAADGKAVYFKGEDSSKDIHYLVHLTPNAEDGKVTEITATYSDVTHLVRQMREAEKFNKEKASFWRNVNYEMRTPMNSIVGVLSLLNETPLDDNQKNYVNIIQESFNTLLYTFDDLLLFSRLETEGVKFEKNDFDLKDLVSSVMESLYIKADKKGLDVNLFYEEDLESFVEGDATRLRHLMHNFTESVINVVPDATDLDVQVDSTPLPYNNALKYSVSFLNKNKTTGKPISINLKDISSVQFAIAHHLVKVMRGEITERTEGDRTFIEFHLDLARSKKQKEESPNIPVGELVGVDILYIMRQGGDEHEDLQKIRDEGGRIIFQYDEISVVDTLLRNKRVGSPYRYLIIDDDAIELSTLELVRKIGDNEELKDTQVVVLLSKEKQKQERIFLKHGVASVLIKPVSASGLFNTILDATRSKPGVGMTDAVEKVAAKVNKAGGKELRFIAQILVAEDNAVNRMMAEKVLEKMGCEVTTVANGHEAVEEVQRRNYDLILMDCQMPVMDGYKASTEIKGLIDAGVMPSLPIIALTAQTGKADRERCIHARMDNYLSKPISMNRLKEVLKMYLRHRMV